MKNIVQCLWICHLLLLGIIFCRVAADAAEDPVREVLRSQNPIWYDSSADNWRRIAAKAPAELPETRLDVPNIGFGAIFTYLMLAILIAIMLWLLFLLFRNLTIDEHVPMEKERRDAVARAVADLSALPFSETDIDDPEKALKEARARRDWRKAVAWSYALHLVELDQASILKISKGTTNRGYLRTVNTWANSSQKRIVIPKLLADAIDTFERTWFGHHDADEVVLQALENGRKQFNTIVMREKEPSA